MVERFVRNEEVAGSNLRRLHVNPSEQGDRTEAVVLSVLAKAGYTVLIPFGVARYDLAIDARDGTGIKTVQVKTGRLVAGCIVFRAHSVDRTSRQRKDYKGQVDYFAVWCPAYGDAVYLVPVEDSPAGMGSLRIEPTKSHQAKGIRWAKDYKIEGS